MLAMFADELQSRYNKTYHAHHICVCNKTGSNDQVILEEILCTNVKESNKVCGRENDVTPVEKKVCRERHNRKKRSSRYHITYLPENFVHPSAAKRIKVI